MVKAVFACFYTLCPPFGLPQLPVQLAEHIPVVILFRTDNIRFDFNDCRIQHMCRTALRQRLYENADPHPPAVEQGWKCRCKSSPFGQGINGKAPYIHVMPCIIQNEIRQGIRIHPIRRHYLPRRRYPPEQLLVLSCRFRLFPVFKQSYYYNRHDYKK